MHHQVHCDRSCVAEGCCDPRLRRVCLLPAIILPNGVEIMLCRLATNLLAVVAIILCFRSTTAHAADKPADSLGKVYGEWRIFVKPDKGEEYDRLIETQGLPLFREAGGRMVGWWKTLIGNLYEQVTIWEYDDMAAFEKAVGFLGAEKRFAAFVAKRDPLLAGEENQFLKLSVEAVSPILHEPAKFVIHEVHRVPLKRQGAYLDYLETEGLNVLKGHGFRPVGPWTTAVGKWTETRMLFRFESLAERERLISEFKASDEGRRYAERIGELVDDVTTRLLLPAPFAKPPKDGNSGRSGAANLLDTSPLLPHLERLTPRVFAAGFADKFRSANCGFLAVSDGTALIDLPRGIAVAEFSREVERLTGRKPNRLLLTHAEKDDLPAVKELVASGVHEVIVTPATRARLLDGNLADHTVPIRVCETVHEVGDAQTPIRFLPADATAAASCAAVELQGEGVLFAGPLVVNGPRARLAGSETEKWVETLTALEGRNFAKVVPGFGSGTSSDAITRERRFLEELRSQVGYAIAMGRPPESLEKQVRISPEFLVWMPYDNPAPEDLLYVYRELTAPVAPFSGREPHPDDQRPHALVLIGDQPHEPQHLERGLRPAFEAAGIVPHFTVDVRALSAENLARVKLLVILRDGFMRPTDDPKSFYCWVTKEHERAVVEFVERGGGFLNLHNALGLYPEDGPYLKLAAGRYIGHGPLERFRIEPVDREHPITRGIAPYSVADEQHTPVVDLPRVKLLFRSYSDSGVEGAAGWVYEPGAGRLCHLANGHTREALLHPTYQRVLRNAMLWCVKRDAPAS
jgi:type 1 glutamine amidotransferase